MNLYLDSSVLVAAFAPEAYTSRALEILGLSSRVMVSELTITETRISLIRKRKRGALTNDEVTAALAELAVAIGDGVLAVAPVPGRE